MSKFFAGILTPKPYFFYALGNFNQAIAQKQIGPIEERWVVDRLKAGAPICREDGTPFDAGDFFGLYVGAIQPPALYGVQAGPTAKQANAFCRDCETAYSLQLHLSGISDRKFWNQLADALEAAGKPEPLIDLLFDVVHSGKKATPEELKPYLDESGQLAIEPLGISMQSPLAEQFFPAD